MSKTLTVSSPIERLASCVAGQKQGSDTLLETVEVVTGFLKTATPDMVPASGVPTIKRDISTTLYTVTFPSGAKSVALSYFLLPGATAVTGQVLKYVVNAASDADATGKLALDACYMLAQGADAQLAADASDPIYRIDFIADQAVGAEKTILMIAAGV